MAGKMSGAERQAALREKGRQVAVILRDPEAILALDALVKKHSGVTAAISFALIAAGKRIVTSKV